MHEHNHTGTGRKGRWLELSELALSRAAHLPQEDRILLEAALGQGRSAREISLLVGRSPRAVRRRLRRLSRRVLSDRFAFVLRHRETWPATRRRIATACILHGRPIRQTAGDLRTSVYNVRKHLDAVAALLDAFTPRPHDFTSPQSDPRAPSGAPDASDST